MPTQRSCIYPAVLFILNVPQVPQTAENKRSARNKRASGKHTCVGTGLNLPLTCALGCGRATRRDKGMDPDQHGYDRGRGQLLAVGLTMTTTQSVNIYFSTVCRERESRDCRLLL